MSCESLTGGISKGCGNNMGGVSAIYVTELSNITGYTQSGGTVSSINMTGSFYEFEFNRNTSLFEENQPINIENGSAYYEQRVTLVIPKRDVEKRNILKTLAQKELAIIVRDGNDILWLIGEDNGALLTESTSGSGQAKADGSKYSLVFVAEELEPAPVVTEAALIAVLS